MVALSEVYHLQLSSPSFGGYRSLKEHERSSLSECAIADVICIVSVISLLNIFESNTFSVGQALTNFGQSFFVVIGTGLIGGIFWASFRDRLKNIESIFTIPALVCILYGITELLQGSGAIAVLVFGIMLGNLSYLEQITMNGVQYFPKNQLSSKEVELFNQLVDLLKTFFFIYIGISLEFVSPEIILFCLGLLLIIHLFRIPVVMVTISSHIPRFDMFVASSMIPKGLASAVLASLPMQFGVEGAEKLQPIVFTIIILSICSSTIITYILDKNSGPIEKELHS